MTTTILVAGMRGVGKSTLLKTYSEKMICIESEFVQAEAVLVAKGEDFDSKYRWSVWDEELKSRARELLVAGLKRQYPNLQPSDMPILLVGALLQQDWFREGCLYALSLMFPVQVRNVHNYLLHLDAATVSTQIEMRLRDPLESLGRGREREYVSNYAKIENERDEYWGGAGAIWKQVNSHADLALLIEEHIKHSSHQK